MTPVDVIRGTLTELSSMTPDEIAGKLRAEGMLWCDSVPKQRAMSCPLHHLLTARLTAAGMTAVFAVAPNFVYVVDNTDISFSGSSVQSFINRFDAGEYT